MENKKNTKAILRKKISYSLIVLVFLLVILFVAPSRGSGAIIFLTAFFGIIYIIVWNIILSRNLSNYMVDYARQAIQKRYPSNVWKYFCKRY